MGWAGAKASDPGSWGLYAKYYDQGAPTVIDHTMNGAWDKFDGEGFKGYNVGGNVKFAKNMVATVEYYDLKGKESDQYARTLLVSARCYVLNPFRADKRTVLRHCPLFLAAGTTA